MRPLLWLAAGLLTFAVVGSLISQVDFTPAFDPVAHTRQQLEIERLERLAERQAALEPLEATLAVFWRVAALVAACGVLAYVALVGYLNVADRRARIGYAAPDEAGRLPLHLTDRDAAVAALAAFHRTEHARASVGPVPVTYAPHVTLHNAAPPAPAPAPANLPGDVSSSTPLVVPSLRELLDAGRVGRGPDGRALPILLGVDGRTGAELPGSWLDLYSCAVGGLAGSGKTSTALFLLSQAAMHRARFVLLDPHAGNAESLAARLAPLAGAYACAPAESPRDMRESLALVADELRRRAAPGSGYVRGSAPLVLVADEFAALQRGEIAEPLRELVESLGQEGRKLDLFALVASQVWTASRAGGSELRDSLASAYIHRLRPSQARMLSGLPAAELPSDLLALPAGHAYLLSTAGDLRLVAIPQVGQGDLDRVAAMLDSAPAPAPAPAPARLPLGFRTSTSGKPSGKPAGSLPEACDNQASKASVSAEAQRAHALFTSGLDIPQIVKELYGIEPTGGRRYQEAARQVQRLIREALNGGEL